MNDNEVRLKVIKQEILLNTIAEKTKCCSIHWTRVEPYLLSSTFDEWEVHVQKLIGSSTKYFLRLYQDDEVCVEMNDTDTDLVEELYDTIDEVIQDQTPDCGEEFVVALDALSCCRVLLLGLGGVSIGGMAIMNVYNETGSGGISLAGSASNTIRSSNIASGGSVLSGIAFEEVV